MLPRLDTDRDSCVKNYGEDDWSQNFRVTVTLAEGAPARVSAINQSLFTFKPDYIHIIQEGEIIKTGDASLAKILEGSHENDVAEGKFYEDFNNIAKDIIS